MATVAHAFRDAFLMAWEVWWALVLGFLISAIVQAWVPRERVERALAGRGPRSVVRATALGAASSSCSYAAVAIAKSLFTRGASLASALAFEIASTNLVWELGLVLWVLLGWQFTLGEYLGGIAMIAIVAVALRLAVAPALEARARRHAERAQSGHVHHSASRPGSLRERLGSLSAWSDVAHNFRGDWQMLWKEIALGFVLAGFAAQLGHGAFTALFAKGAPGPVAAIENAVVGPLIAIASFVCSIGNVPLAAVLWAGGISFAGVMAFILADLIVLPIVLIYRKYYGLGVAVRITLLLFAAMVLAGLAIDGLFHALGIVPTGARPTRADIFGAVRVDYKLVLNAIALAVFVALLALTVRRGARDPVCGMTVDRAEAITRERDGATLHFCSEACLQTFDARRGDALRAKV
jgi:uncharacterized protein